MSDTRVTFDPDSKQTRVLSLCPVPSTRGVTSGHRSKSGKRRESRFRPTVVQEVETPHLTVSVETFGLGKEGPDVTGRGESKPPTQCLQEGFLETVVTSQGLSAALSLGPVRRPLPDGVSLVLRDSQNHLLESTSTVRSPRTRSRVLETYEDSSPQTRLYAKKRSRTSPFPFASGGTTRYEVTGLLAV